MNNQFFAKLETNHLLTTWLICLSLVIMTAAVYLPVRNHDFIMFDDDLYITDNLYVQSGLSSDSINWAFSAAKNDERAYWHPLTWMSHMLDCQLFGLNAAYHHLANMFYHLINTLLLFFVFNRMTGEIWKSAFVAALFALHPLNVDSVAWVAERKNLLSTTFWLLTMLAYIFYARHPSVPRYLLVFAAMATGLLAKPMLVTLPCVLFLMDVWPLNRLPFIQQTISDNPPYPQVSWFRSIAEKIPLLVLSGAATILASISIHHNNDFISFETVPLGLRLQNAIVSYIQYIIKLLWPHDLAILYPFPDSIPAWQVLGASLLLIIIFSIVILQARKNPFLAFGWLWFFGTLVPVIGIVQGGLWPAMADRWMYVPAIGLFVIAVWGGFAMIEKISQKKTLKIILPGLILLSLIWISSSQIKHWKNDISLFSHTVAVTSDNSVAHYNLGVAFGENEDLDSAIYHYLEALRIDPENQFVRSNLGNALYLKGQLDEAARHYNIAVGIDTRNDIAYVGLGNVFAGKKKLNKSLSYYLQALEANPYNDSAAENIGKIMFQQGNIAGAIHFFKKAVNINPNLKDAKKALQQFVIIEKKINDQAAKILQQIQSTPDDVALYEQLGKLYQSTGYYDKAVQQYKDILQISPNEISALYSLGITYTLKNDYDIAIRTFKKILQSEPGNAAVLYNISCVYARQNNINEAIAWLQKAIEKGYDNLDNLQNDPDMDDLRNEPMFRQIIDRLSSKTMKSGSSPG